ncbi:phosphodiester glycosidase family protein [Microbispora siamensis]
MRSFKDAGHTLVLATWDGPGGTGKGGVGIDKEARDLVAMGVETAVNLDGGGSTTVVARALGAQDATLRNAPSDGGERSDPNGVGVFVAKGDGKLHQLLIKPAPGAASADGGVKVFPGLHRALIAQGVDDHQTPVTVDPASVRWSGSGASVTDGVTRSRSSRGCSRTSVTPRTRARRWSDPTPRSPTSTASKASRTRTVLPSSGKNPYGTPDRGGFTGWVDWSVDSRRTADQQWIEADVRAFAQSITLDTPDSLQVSKTAQLSGSIVQPEGVSTGTRVVPLQYPMSVHWGGSSSLAIGSGKAAIDAARRAHKVAILDPQTRTLTALQPGSVTVSVTNDSMRAYTDDSSLAPITTSKTIQVVPSR